MESNINHPSHYGGDTPYEAIKVIEAWNLGFCLGNTIKYISRAGKKDPAKEIEDLEKAKWYLERRISQLKTSENGSILNSLHFNINLEDIQNEMNRVREIIKKHKELPNNTGMDAAMLMEQDIENCEKAISSGDTVLMLRIYKEMQEWRL